MEEQKFEPYQKVLVRISGEWNAAFYSHRAEDSGWHFTTNYSGVPSDRILPYNDETKHLLGTEDDFKPKRKWKPKQGQLVAAFDYRGGRVHALTFSRSVEVDGTTRYLTKESWQSVETSWNFCEPLRKHFDIPDEE